MGIPREEISGSSTFSNPHCWRAVAPPKFNILVKICGLFVVWDQSGPLVATHFTLTHKI